MALRTMPKSCRHFMNIIVISSTSIFFEQINNSHLRLKISRNRSLESQNILGVILSVVRKGELKQNLFGLALTQSSYHIGRALVTFPCFTRSVFNIYLTV